MLKKEFSEIISYWKSFNTGDAFADFSSTKYTCEIGKLEIPDKAICNDINEFISNIKHREISGSDKSIWDEGWGQNYQYLLNNVGIDYALVPSYIAKYPFIRLLGQLYIDNSLVNRPINEMITNPERNKSQEIRYKSAEYIFYRIMVEQLIFYPALKYFRDRDCTEPLILDLGAGTCHNLWHFCSFLLRNNIKPRFLAADWSSATENIANYLRQKTDVDVNYSFIDFNRKETWKFIDEQNIDFTYTVGSLEQLPGDPLPLIQKLNSNKSKMNKIIAIEPMQEALSAFNREDKITIEYINKRNYLNSFLSSLLISEVEGKKDLNVSINRVGYGSLFLDAYTRLNWINNNQS